MERITELASALADKTGLTKSEAKDIIDDLFGILEDELRAGRPVKITGLLTLYFGVTPAKKKGSVVRNPFDGTERKLDAAVPAKLTVKAKVGTKLKKAVPTINSAAGKAIIASKK